MTPISLSQEEQEEHARLLGERLRTLIDIAKARDEREVTYTDVEQFLLERDIPLSRGRWQYMVHGTRYVDDVTLVDAISDFFQVPRAYLRGNTEPEQVAAELDLVRAFRAKKVHTFAARTLGDLSPGVLNAITKILDQEAARAGEA